MKQFLIQTERTTLRFPEKRDITALVWYLNDPDVVYQLRELPQPYTADEGRKFLEISSNSRSKGYSLELAIEYKDTGELIGTIGAKFPSHDKKQTEIGYWLGKPFWGMGIMSETIKAFLEFITKEYNPEVFFAYVYGGNEASFSVLEKQGFINKGLAEIQFCNSRNKNPVYRLEKPIGYVSRETT